MNRLTQLLFFLVSLGVANVQASIITLDSGVQISAYDIDENQYSSFADFYDYNAANKWSSNTGFEQKNTAVLFLASYNNELALFSLLSKGGQGAQGSTTISLGNRLNVADINLVENEKNDPADMKDTSVDPWLANFYWNAPYGDGFILELSDFNDFSFDLAFSDNTTGLTSFKFLSFDHGKPIEYDFSGTRAVSVTSVSEPGTLALFGLALFGAAAIRRKK